MGRAKVMNHETEESIRFWQTPPLNGVELLTARYIEHRFVPHVHDGFVIGMIMAGAQRYRYRGAEHLAPTGTLVLINPDEVHNGHKGHDAGWHYRAFYPDNAQLHGLLEELGLPSTHLPTFNETLLQDPDLFNGLRQLHQLLEGPESALHQQTVWRQMMLALLNLSSFLRRRTRSLCCCTCSSSCRRPHRARRPARPGAASQNCFCRGQIAIHAQRGRNPGRAAGVF